MGNALNKEWDHIVSGTAKTRLATMWQNDIRLGERLSPGLALKIKPNLHEGLQDHIQLLTLQFCPLHASQWFWLAWTELHTMKSQVYNSWTLFLNHNWLNLYHLRYTPTENRQPLIRLMDDRTNFFRIRVLILSHYHWQAAIPIFFF